MSDIETALCVTGKLIFYVNGRKIIEENVEPDWTLLTYLRLKLSLCGTKLGCGEGGCGACTVMVSKLNRRTKRIEHFSVNACLAPVASMHGLAVTTVEGIGSTKTRLHVVQERLAKAHGSQCGFCTPGIVMSMYTLLRNNPKPSEDDLHTYFQGNLCRCTGYRPIIEGFRPFAEPWSSVCENGASNGSLNGYEGSNKPCGGAAGGRCCREIEDLPNGIGVPNDLLPYKPDCEPIFPPGLQLSSSLDEERLFFRGRNVHWYRPLHLSDLLKLKKEHPNAKLVCGNTELGIEVKFKNCQYPIMIQPSHVKELTSVTENQDGITFGASVTLTELEAICLEQSRQHPPWKVQVFTEVVKILHYFGGKQIRNVAAIGGNIMTSSPISDLNGIWLAAGSVLDVRSTTGRRQIKMDSQFFTGYRQNVIKPEEVLVSIKVPYLDENEHFAAFKQARRRDDDIAIVNAAFRLQLQDYTVKDIAMCFGGMSATAVFAPKTADSMRGKEWNKETIDAALSLLVKDLPLDPSAPGGMVRYRQSLALSFLFKFYHKVSVQLYPSPCSSETLSAVEPLTRLGPKGSQTYAVSGDSFTAVGKAHMHASGALHTTGEAVYCDDIPKYQNELYLGLVLSEKAHAKILRIDAGDALKLEGVEGFICHEDLPKQRNLFGVTGIYVDEEVFASTEVNCVGQIIGAIIARDQACAKCAARAVRVTYEELPSVITIEQAIAADSFLTSPVSISCGNANDRFSKCDHVIDGDVRSGAQEHFYLETQAVIAVPKGEWGEMEIIASTQNPTRTQKVVAQVLGVAEHKVVCKVKRMGGGFGGKETRGVPISAAVAAAAQKMNRPVRIMLDRDEDIMVSGWRHSFRSKYKVGFTKDGVLQAFSLDMFNNAGWSMDLSFAVMNKAVLDAATPYRIPNMHVKGRVCKTNLPSCTAFRGFGGPQSMFVNENVLSDVALFLDKDPCKIRECNFMKSEHKTHYGQFIEANCLRRCWDECLMRSKYVDVKEEIAKFNSEHKWKKRGISINPTIFGISFFEDKFLNQAGAFVNVYTDGSVLLTHGGTEMGQGLHTKMIQIASEALDIDISKIHISEASTDKVPNTTATAGSVSTDINGMAVHNACMEIKRRLAPYRANGRTWEEAVLAAYFDQVSLSATGHFARPDIGYDIETNQGKAYSYFTNGAACSLVEIDCLTGDHRILKTDIVMDVGKSINPAIDVGQIEGAFIQGYGLFVLEQMVHSPSGVPFTRGPGAYKIPSFDDVPGEFNVTLLKDSENPHAVHSSKGIGEPAVALASSVFFAIKDAIVAARKERGLSPMFQLMAPATAERIRMLCEDELTERVPTIKEGTYKPWAIQI